jgi:deoxyhypusine synthase
MKCSGDFLMGDFDMNDEELHKKGINRIGNVLVSNKMYIGLEKALQPFFGQVYARQKETGKMLAPSEIIAMLGETVKDENSMLYWASKNKIPMYCPAITDGAFGLQAFFFKQDHKDFGIDVTADMAQLSSLTFKTKKTGAIILGGGVAKHHTIGANLLRGGLDYAVYVGTSDESDGSMSGARTKEAVSWGKIKEGRDHVSVTGEATVVFPLIVACMVGSV